MTPVERYSILEDGGVTDIVRSGLIWTGFFITIIAAAQPIKPRAATTPTAAKTLVRVLVFVEVVAILRNVTTN
jgi:hypothetical protein